MNISTLQQFLQTLIEPLKGLGTSEHDLADVERIVKGLEPFAKKPVGEFAHFLVRAHDYERDGHWPSANPPIRGGVVDRPSPADYASRLKALVERERAASGPVPEIVFAEFKALQTSLKLPQLSEMATACGVSGNYKTVPSVVAKVFEHLTGRKFDEAVLELHQANLNRSRHHGPQLELELGKVKGALGLPQIKKLAKKLGVSGTPRSADEAINKIRETLAPASDGQLLAPPLSSPVDGPTSLDEDTAKLARIVETLRELKRKADPEGAAYEEIEEEFNRLGEMVSTEQAVAAAKQIGVEWSVHNKSDALKRIREKVFERKRIRERIQH